MNRMITVCDKMQKKYSYELQEAEGSNFNKDFKPELSPKEMLHLGVFEGKYINDCVAEFPNDWFKSAKLAKDKPDIGVNCFKIKSRQPLSYWRTKGWILEPDVRGWFQWYCRYFMGRRIQEIDIIQIKRWKAFKRHKYQILNNCKKNDLGCRPKQRQALLQWAYNPFF